MTTPPQHPRCTLCLAEPSSDAERAAMLTSGRCDACEVDFAARQSGEWAVADTVPDAKGDA